MTNPRLSEQLIVALLLIVSIPGATPANAWSQETDQTLSARDEHEAREFAKRVAAHLERTRDLTPYLSKPPASALLYRLITDPDSDQIVDKNVVRKVGTDQARRFYIALWNVAYLSETYVYSRLLLRKTAIGDLRPEQQYPDHVVRFLKRNPQVKRWWNDESSGSEHVTTVDQFHSLLQTFNEAAVLMRGYFRRHPPESTSIYKQNLKYRRAFLSEITVDTCEQDCVGFSVGTQMINVNLPVLQVVLVRLNGRLQLLLVGLHDD